MPTKKPDSETPNSVSPGALAGFEVVVGVTGGIAAYKTCAVVSALVQQGAGVTCVMTEAATHFVGPLTFQTLTGRSVLTSMWEAQDSHDPQHLAISDRANLVLIAPATANIIAKIACGLADDLLSTMLLGVSCPVIVAPAMNDRMWAADVVQANVARLREMGIRIIEPRDGWLACRSTGPGRMEEPDAIVRTVVEVLVA